MSVLLALTAATLFSLGTWLLLQRRLTRIVIGIGLIGHGTNILLITSGGGGGIPPVIGKGDKEDFADPLPQALALTAIVITFGVTAFLLAMAYRSWKAPPAVAQVSGTGQSASTTQRTLVVTEHVPPSPPSLGVVCGPAPKVGPA